MIKKLFKIGVWIVILGAGAGAAWFFFGRSGEAMTVYSTSPVGFGEMRRVISSTGTVEPEELVNVGSQINGMITKFGTDLNGNTVDYGSQVKSGEVLAWIDDSLYTAEVRVAEAACEQAEAEIASAKAEIEQSEAASTLAGLEYERAKKLRPQNVISQSDYDTAESTYVNARAAINVSRAKLSQAYAQLSSAKASLTKAQRNFGYCIIKSPVDGVIIDRRVNIGQTVVSSMSASSLFLIAKDLRKMQVWVSVNEADIGEIKPGLPVLFTVDAFPGRTFQGSVHKIRLNATMSQNVVTYVVEIDTDNSDGTLLPYLTANVKFITAERQEVFFVPNAALRFVPEGIEIPEISEEQKLLWIKDDSVADGIRSIAVTPGLNDGSFTEVSGDGLHPDMEVVTKESRMEVSALNASGGDAKSPFLPSMPRRPGSKAKTGVK